MPPANPLTGDRAGSFREVRFALKPGCLRWSQGTLVPSDGGETDRRCLEAQRLRKTLWNRSCQDSECGAVHGGTFSSRSPGRGRDSSVCSSRPGIVI